MTQKISNYVGKKDFSRPLELGNLNARRDIGSAQDYVECIYKMMQQAEPRSYVIATGETHSVREFVELAFRVIGISISWRGSGLEEVGYDRDRGTVLVIVNARYFRDIDIECLLGDSTRARSELGWAPKQSFSELVSEMVVSALDRHGNNNKNAVCNPYSCGLA